jgi:hypothetical protein
MADMLSWAGYKQMLRAPFRGTLLLPTNDVSAARYTQHCQET